MAVKW